MNALAMLAWETHQLRVRMELGLAALNETGRLYLDERLKSVREDLEHPAHDVGKGGE